MYEPKEVINSFESSSKAGLRPSSDSTECNISTVTDLTESWKTKSQKIVFTAGVFDIFTLNHLLALHYYKSIGGGRSCRLVISLDTDKRAASMKSFKESKGGSNRPIISWRNRSLMVLKQSYNNSSKLVDIVTQHGSDTCSGASCSHDNDVTLAETIKPDIFVINDASTSTIDMARSSTVLAPESILLISEQELSYNDKLLGGRISTTQIIKRARL